MSRTGSRIREPSVTHPAKRAKADEEADAVGGSGSGEKRTAAGAKRNKGAMAQHDEARRVELEARRVERAVARLNMARAFLVALGLIAVGLEAAGRAAASAEAMVMAGSGLEALVQALRLCRQAAAVKGGFCDTAAGKRWAPWPSWRQGMQLWRWGWPDWGRGTLGANGHVSTCPNHPFSKRPEDENPSMGARAYKVLLPLKKW